jgi:hypothetical protein
MRLIRRNRDQPLRRFFAPRIRDQRNEIAELRAEIAALRARLEFRGDDPDQVNAAVQRSRDEAADAHRRWGIA